MRRVKSCVICGKKPIGYTGYIFFEDGKEQVGAPWCPEHLAIANQKVLPVFENENAKELFAKRHPRLYSKIKIFVFLGGG